MSLIAHDITHPVKDDWSLAPDWATCLCTDANGDRYWFENEPTHADIEWINKNGGRIQLAFRAPDWHNAIERRPTLIENKPIDLAKDHPEFVHLLGRILDPNEL